MLLLLQALKTYFIDNPTQEIEALNVSAVRAGALITDLTNALAAVDQQKTKVRNLMTARDLSAKAVRGDMLSLVAELNRKLDPLAAEWEDFGLKRPGALAIPTVPSNVTAVVIGPNAVAVKWDQAERASHYRVWKRVVGVDDELIPSGSPADLDFALEGLPAGATIEIAVSAVNNGGESQKTEVVTVVTGA